MIVLRGRAGVAVALLLVGALVAGAGLLHRGYRASRGSKSVDELLYYPSGVWVKQSSLGYGEHRQSDQRYDMIGHVMDIVSELDPRFIQPYVFGGFTLAQELKQPERGLALLEKGMRANPENWRLAFEVGFLHYVCRHDYAAAGRYFALASRLPDAPDYVARFAAWSNQRAGNTALAILLWKRVDATGNKYMKEIARRELSRLQGAEGL